MFSLKSYNTFKIDAYASEFYRIERVEDLFAVPLHKRERAYILGGGSNTLFTCDNCGVVLHIANKGIDVLYRGDNVVLTVAAGEVWNDVVRFAVENNMRGIENLVDIYGTVGGAAVQNIGAYGSEFKDVVISVDVIDLLSGDKFSLSAAECEYGYRDSIFKRQPHWLVWGVQLGLMVEGGASEGVSDRASAAARQSAAVVGGNGDSVNVAVDRDRKGIVSNKRSVLGNTPKEIAAQISALRSSKLPPLELYGSAGSFFKNPIITEAQFNAIHAQYPDLNGYPVDSGGGAAGAAGAAAVDTADMVCTTAGAAGTMAGVAGAAAVDTADMVCTTAGAAGTMASAAGIKISAGFLIEKCGFKGIRDGNAGVYEKQALVLINFGGATGAEVLSLAQKIIAAVKEKFDITLLPEVVVL